MLSHCWHPTRLHLWLPQNARKGDFARHKMRGKRAIELGAGMGLGGLAFAMLGAEVALTDVAAVLPLLQRNYQNNLSPAALRGENEVNLQSSHWEGGGGLSYRYMLDEGQDIC